MDWLELLGKGLSYGFIQRAVLAGIFIAISTSVLGLFLVLKKMSLIGEGLAHLSFASVAFALALGFSPLYFSIPLVIVFSLLMLKLTEKGAVNADASIGLISSLGLAAGALITSITGGFGTDIVGFLFGSILTVTWAEVGLSVFLSLVVLVIVFFYYKELFTVCYDEDFAHCSGLSVKRINQLLSILTAVTVSVSVRLFGVMLVSSLIIFPSVTALQVSKRFKGALGLSVLFATSSVVLSIFLSFVFNLPAGATIVLFEGLLFLIIFLISKALKLR